MGRKYEVEWLTEQPHLTEDEYVTLEKEIDYISESIEKASDLIFHTVNLTDDPDVRVIIIDSKDGVDNTLYLTYYDKIEHVWVA